MMWRNRLGQTNLFPRIAWGIALGFLGLHLLYTARSAHEQMLSSARAFTLSTIDRAVGLAEVAAVEPALVQRLSSPGFRAEVRDDMPQRSGRAWEHDIEVRARALELLADTDALSQVETFWFEVPERTRSWDGRRQRRPGPEFVVVVPAGERWLLARADLRAATWRNQPARRFGTIVFALAIIALVLFVARRAIRYFPRFADAAQRLGAGDLSHPIAVEGPSEVQRAARAFNDMQARVQDYLAERTAMMAAFSHDLRTLLTRMRLRLDAQDALQTDDALTADMDAMTRILDEALSYAREDSNSEAFRAVNLEALVQTVLTGAGLDAEHTLVVVGPATSALVVDAQPTALSRAITNLVDNALKYGGGVLVELEALVSDEIRLAVFDPGPGIPAADQQRALRPYVRLEPSRNRYTGGTGLGLAIVAQIVRRHGATLRFLNERRSHDGRVFAFGVGFNIPQTRQ
ncbi:MAG: ATP-binding protein [Pseudomonadota bacterium]